MSATITLPAIKLFVRKKYIVYDPEDGFIEAYLMAVTAINGKALKFTVLTEHGAIYSGLPIEALFIKPSFEKIYDTPKLQPFSALEGPVSCVVLPLVQEAICNVIPLGESAQYLFSLFYESSLGLADDPEQNKSHNIVALSSGQLAAMPNNYLLFTNNWFCDTLNTVTYKRQKQKFYPGG